jgi:hypothetical protein
LRPDRVLSNPAELERPRPAAAHHVGAAGRGARRRACRVAAGFRSLAARRRAGMRMQATVVGNIAPASRPTVLCREPRSTTSCWPRYRSSLPTSSPGGRARPHPQVLVAASTITHHGQSTNQLSTFLNRGSGYQSQTVHPDRSRHAGGTQHQSGYGTAQRSARTSAVLDVTFAIMASGQQPDCAIF